MNLTGAASRVDIRSMQNKLDFHTFPIGFTQFLHEGVMVWRKHSDEPDEFYTDKEITDEQYEAIKSRF